MFQWNTFQSINIKYYFFHWSKKNSNINVYAQNFTMIIYDKFTTLSSHETFTILGVEFIIAIFNTNIIKAIHIITINKPSTLLLSTFINQLQKLLNLMPTYCVAIIMGDLNIDMFDQNTTQPNELKFFYELLFNGTSILKIRNKLWYPYWSHMDEFTHWTMDVKSYWSILD